MRCRSRRVPSGKTSQPSGCRRPFSSRGAECPTCGIGQQPLSGPNDGECRVHSRHAASELRRGCHIVATATGIRQSGPTAEWSPGACRSRGSGLGGELDNCRVLLARFRLICSISRLPSHGRVRRHPSADKQRAVHARACPESVDVARLCRTRASSRSWPNCRAASGQPASPTH